MADIIVPDIGDFTDIPVIEVLVKPGDVVGKNDSVVTLESDKASMEVPAGIDGTIGEIRVKVGDKVSKGTVIATTSGTAAAPAPAAPAAAKAIVELTVPDIGDFEGIPVIDVMIAPGDAVEPEQSIVTLESDKASMDVPATSGGVVKDVRVKVGDKVSKGTVLATIESSAAAAPSTPASPTLGMTKAADAATPAPAITTATDASLVIPSVGEAGVKGPPQGAASIAHASPSIRRFARELGVAIGEVRGTGPKARITREDVQNWVKRALQSGTSADGGFPGLPPWPKVDFAQFGPVERTPLSRIKKLSGPNLHRNWVQIPHITNFDEADITDLEAFRNEINADQTKKGGAKLTMLAFMVKAAVRALQQFPDFNASLDGDALVHKGYYNIGFAADTPNGLVVPVIKNADAKGLLDIAAESAALAAKARDGKLGLADMQGGTFTISSIGGIGGTQFTQIVNAPEVAIMGATRSAMKPVWDGERFVPRLIMPVSVSYDHRVIDGASAARFLVYLTGLLEDFRRTAL